MSFTIFLLVGEEDIIAIIPYGRGRSPLIAEYTEVSREIDWPRKRHYVPPLGAVVACATHIVRQVRLQQIGAKGSSGLLTLHV